MGVPDTPSLKQIIALILLVLFVGFLIGLVISFLFKPVAPQQSQSSQYKVSTEFKEFILKNCTNNPCTMTLDNVKYDVQLSNQEVK